MLVAVAVKSRMIERVQYDDIQHELRLTFKGSGGEYIYSEVPVDVYRALIAAPSVGEFVKANIKGVYAYRRAENATS